MSNLFQSQIEKSLQKSTRDRLSHRSRSAEDRHRRSSTLPTPNGTTTPEAEPAAIGSIPAASSSQQSLINQSKRDVQHLDVPNGNMAQSLSNTTLTSQMSQQAAASSAKDVFLNYFFGNDTNPKPLLDTSAHHRSVSDEPTFARSMRHRDRESRRMAELTSDLPAHFEEAIDLEVRLHMALCIYLHFSTRNLSLRNVNKSKLILSGVLFRVISILFEKAFKIWYQKRLCICL